MAGPPPSIRTSEDRQVERDRSSRRDVLTDPVLRRAAALGVVWLLSFAALTALLSGSDTGRLWLGNVAYLLPIAVATVLTALVARRTAGRGRRFWSLLTLSNALWLGGELCWSTYEFATPDGPPFPSVADGFYLSSYALVVPAVVLGFGIGRLRVSRALLDASVIAASLGLLGWELLIAPQLAGGASLATVVGIAYPLLGVVILVVLTVLGYGGHRGVPLSVGLVTVAFAVTALTDVAYTYAVVLHEYVPGGWLNLGWQLEAVLLCLAALAALRHPQGQLRVAPLRSDTTLPLLLFGAATTGVSTLVDSRSGSVSTRAGALALLTLAAVVARLVITVREKEHAAAALREALAEQERLAITDGLTGLHNRRFAEEILRIEADRATRSGRPLSLLVLDVDHFKRVNDTHGHAVGDVVLREVARRLVASARPTDVVARYGGEEFVLLLPEVSSEAAAEIAERCRVTVHAQPVQVDGHEVSVSASLGVATLGEHADDVDGLLREADASLYLAKDLGRNRVQVGAAAGPEAAAPAPVSPMVLFLCTLADQVDRLVSTSEHSAAVGRWASAVAAALGLDAEAQHDCYWAGRLHDIGKIQVPASVLGKPGRLDDHEWRLIQEHPRAGSELLAMVPDTERLATLVEQHHERVDGTGYPRGLAGPEIALEARIVAVCDAYAAMRASRPYQPQRTAVGARQELLRGAGTQWDVNVVEAFVRLLDGQQIDDLADLPSPDAPGAVSAVQSAG